MFPVTVGTVTAEFPVTFGTATVVFPVTLLILVVTNLLAVLVTFETVSVPLVGTISVTTSFLLVSADTDLTKVSVVEEAYPVTTVCESLLFQVVEPPDADALRYLVVSPKVISGALAVNVVSEPKTESLVGVPCVTDPLLKANVVFSPNTLSVVAFGNETVPLTANVVSSPRTLSEVVVRPIADKSPNSCHFPSAPKINSFESYITILPLATGYVVPPTTTCETELPSVIAVVVIPIKCVEPSNAAMRSLASLSFIQYWPLEGSSILLI